VEADLSSFRQTQKAGREWSYSNIKQTACQLDVAASGWFKSKAVARKRRQQS